MCDGIVPLHNLEMVSSYRVLVALLFDVLLKCWFTEMYTALDHNIVYVFVSQSVIDSVCRSDGQEAGQYVSNSTSQPSNAVQWEVSQLVSD